MKIHNWSDLIISALLGVGIIVYKMFNYEDITDIPLILYGVYIIISGIYDSFKIEKHEIEPEKIAYSKNLSQKMLDKYGKKIRILQYGPSVILFLAIIVRLIFKEHDWTAIALFIAIAQYVILTLIVTIIEYQFDDK